MLIAMLIAETLPTAAVGLGSTGAGILATLAVLRWRADKAEQKNQAQDVAQKETAKALAELTAAVRVQGADVRASILASEAHTDRKLNDLSQTLTRKIEGLREAQAAHGERLAALERTAKD